MTDAPDQPDDGVTFFPMCGVEAAFIGAHLIGVVRANPPGWRSFLAGEPRVPWCDARDLDAAKAALRRHARDWYDALHVRLAPAQAERIAAMWMR